MNVQAETDETKKPFGLWMPKDGRWRTDVHGNTLRFATEDDAATHLIAVRLSFQQDFQWLVKDEPRRFDQSADKGVYDSANLRAMR